MRARFLTLAVAALTATVLAAPAFAAEPKVAPKGEWVEPPKTLPHVSLRDSVNNLDFLFGALKAAPDEETAKAIEQRIGHVFQFLGFGPTHAAMLDDVAVEMPALETLRRRRGKTLCQQQRLDFAGLEGAQHAPQSQGAAAVALRLANRFLNQSLAAMGAKCAE